MLVTLTTDYGLRDGYAAAVKGTMLTLAPSVQIVDVTHAVPPQDVMEAAFVLGEMQATLLQWQRLDDGSVELSYLRRLHEQIVLDPELAAELIEEIEKKIEANETITFDAAFLDELRARQGERSGSTGSK